MMRRIILSILILLVTASLALAEPVKLPRPIRVEVYCKPVDGAAQQKFTGDLIAYNDESIIVKTRDGERTHLWTDLYPANAYTIRAKLIDRKRASDWLELGRFAWALGAKTEASGALTTAVKMDKSLKAQADEIFASESGGGLNRSASTQSSEAPKGSAAEKSAPDKPAPPAIGDSPGGLPPAQPTKRLQKDQVVKYQKATPEEHALAIEEARTLANKVSDEMNLTFTEFQTDHFICFNNWDKREAGFLKENLEGAYTVVSKQFEIPVKENVFVGKLPVFMFAKHEDFKKFAAKVDKFPVADTIAGYYVTMVNSEGEQSGGHMAMWKPDVKGNNVADAEKRWAYTLVHEFTHAFVARYRSNQRVPRWLNEGVAEVIANEKFPRDGARDWARRMAIQNDNVATVFDDDKMPGGEMYPVMMTMVQTLIAHDRKAFLRYFEDIKAGADPEEALKKHFKTDYDGLLSAWKKYLTTR